MATKFFLCTTCGNVVVKAIDSGVKVVCCGKEMTELIPNTTDAMMEKHLPVVEHIDGRTVRVKVGSMPHPMTKEHHICFIYLETEHGGQIQYLDPEGPAEAFFCGCKDKPVAVYGYCNLHGLWKTEIRDCPADREEGCDVGKKGCCK